MTASLRKFNSPSGLAYLEKGQGEAIVFIHGEGLNADMWSPQFDEFSGTHRVIAIDLATPDDPTLEYFVGSVVKFLDHMNIARANLVGHAMGGLVALGVALNSPQRCLRVGVLNGVYQGGQLSQLHMPALFATGRRDEQATPALVMAMAKAAPRAKAVILDDPAAANHALRGLMAQPPTAFDVRELRSAFGSFMTGVTIITTIDDNGHPRGFTANSFTSVSIDPPLLLVCIGKKAASHDNFSRAPGFAVNILSEKQKTASGIFASKRPDKFTDVAWHEAESGNPIIDGAAAWFDCVRHQIIDAGDHIIMLGAIRGFARADANPLGYARGGYVTLGLEQEAVNAASGGRTVVGAILECGGQLVLARDAASDVMYLPEVGRTGPSGSASLLHEDLRRAGLETGLGFLFSVFENPQTKVQFIYYRGDATLRDKNAYELAAFDAIPWDRLPDEATRIMLRRYADERRQGRFKIYSGDHGSGEIRAQD